jgi:monoamine oxidase
VPENTPEIFDCLILGAGAAGLAAAADLVAVGKKILVLEARDRIGGRIHTSHDSSWPIPIDRGAEFVHGKPTETWKIISAANLLAYDVPDSHWRFNGKTLKQENFYDKIDPVFERLTKHKGPDQSFEEFLARLKKIPKDSAALAKMYVEGFDAADAKQVGIRWLARSAADEEKIGDQLSRIVGGYDQVITHLAARVGNQNIQLQTIVSAIQYSRGEVRMTARDGSEYRARSAVITLPLGVLLAGDLRFEPEPLEKRGPLSKLKMGGVLKILLNFHEPFWEEKVDEKVNFMHAPGEVLPTWWTQLSLRALVLTGWTGGPTAWKLSQQPAPLILEEALRILAKMLHMSPKKCRSLLKSWQICDWQNDPFSRGAYSYGGVGGANAAAQLAKPVDQTLFFAGEATHPGMSGTVAGAIGSGQRAAAEILVAD